MSQARHAWLHVHFQSTAVWCGLDGQDNSLKNRFLVFFPISCPTFQPKSYINCTSYATKILPFCWNLPRKPWLLLLALRLYVLKPCLYLKTVWVLLPHPKKGKEMCHYLDSLICALGFNPYILGIVNIFDVSRAFQGKIILQENWIKGENIIKENW